MINYILRVIFIVVPKTNYSGLGCRQGGKRRKSLSLDRIKSASGAKMPSR